MGSKISSITSKFVPSKKSKDEFTIVSRTKWGARVPKWREDLIYPALSATITFTETPTCKSKTECIRASQELQNKHMDEDGLPDIEYSFLVGGDGTVFEGRGWHTISNRKKTINCIDPEYPTQYKIHNKVEEKNSPDRRIVIAFIGEENKDSTNLEMQKAVKKLIKFGLSNYYIESDNPNPEDRNGTIEEAMKEVENDEEQGQ